MDELHEIQFDPTNATQTTFINVGLTENIKELITFLKENIGSFAWSHANKMGINLEMMLHQLNVDSNLKPAKQKRRKFRIERNKAINEEVARLLENGLIRE